MNNVVLWIILTVLIDISLEIDDQFRLTTFSLNILIKLQKKEWRRSLALFLINKKIV
jgi:hypothetical protein